MVRRLIVDLSETCDPSIAEEVLDARYVDRSSSFPDMGGVENVKMAVANWRRSSLWTRHVTEDIVAAGERVVGRRVSRATHRGDSMGSRLPARGARWQARLPPSPER